MGSRFLILILTIVAFSTGSCTGLFNKEYYSAEDAASKLQAYFISDSIISVNNGVAVSIEDQVLKAYQLNDYKLLWISPLGAKPSVNEFLIQAGGLQDEGVNFKQVKLSRLEDVTTSILHACGPDRKLNLDSVIAWDIELTTIYLNLAKQLLLGQNENIVSHVNDTIFAGAEYLVLAINKSNNFPSFDGFRPDNPLYSKLLLANKNWMLLQKDEQYNTAKQQFAKGDYSNTLVEYIINRELNIANLNLQGEELIKEYQYFRNIKQTGALDSNTIAVLLRQPKDYKSRIRSNLELLRFLSSQRDEQFIIVNPYNEVYKYYYNGLMVSSGKVKVSNAKPELICNTLLENIIKNPEYEGNINISSIRLGISDLRLESINHVTVVNPRTNLSIPLHEVPKDSLARYLIFEPAHQKQLLPYENINASESGSLAINIWPVKMNDQLKIVFLEAQKLFDAIHEHTISINQSEGIHKATNIVFPKGVPIYVINLSFMSCIHTQELIYLD